MPVESRDLPEMVRRLVGTLCSDRLDADLLAAFSDEQDPNAFAALVSRYGPLVWGVCRRALRDPNDAEDAFQATFLVLAREARQIACRETLSGWLYTVARRVASHLRRSQMRRQEHEQRAVRPVTDRAESPYVDLGDVLDEELARLPDRLRNPLILCYLRGKSHVDAASELGCPVSTLSNRLIRGCEILRSRLARRGLGVAAGHVALALAALRIDAAVPPGVSRTVVANAIQFAAGRTIPTAAGQLALGVASTVGKQKLMCGVLGMVLLLGVAGATTQSQPHSGTPVAQAHQPIQPVANTDSFGDPLPEGAISRIGTLRLRPGHSIGDSSVALTADGRTILSVSAHNFVHHWDLPSGREVERFPGPRVCLGVALSPDGRRLIVGGVEEVWAWELGPEGRRLIWKQRPGGLGFWCVAFAPDGQTVACGGDNQRAIYLLDAATGERRRTLTGRGYKLAFSPDGRTLASWARDEKVCLWEVATGKQQRVLSCDSSDGKLVSSFAFSPDGRTLATAAGDHSIRLWDVATGVERRLTNAADYWTFVAFSPDGRSLLEVGRERIRFWDPATGRECRPAVVAPHLAANTMFDACRLSADGSLFVSANPTAIGVWDVRTGKPVGPSGVPEGPVGSVAFTPDQQRLAVTTVVEGREQLQVYDVLTGRIQTAIRPPTRESEFTIRSEVTFVTDRELAISGLKFHLADSLKGFCLVMGTDPGTPAAEFSGGRGERSMAPSPDGKLVAAGRTAGGVTLYDRASGDLVRTWKTQFEVTALSFAANGRVLAGWESNARRINVWDAQAGDRIGSWDVPGQRILDFSLPLALSPDGKRLATGGSFRPESLKVWNTTTGNLFWEVGQPANAACAVSFSPNGRVLATGGEGGEVQLWEVCTGQERLRLHGHRSKVCALAFSRDGDRVASGSTDGTALVWGTRPPGDDLKLGRGSLEALSGSDAVLAYRTVTALADSPKTAVPLIRSYFRNLTPEAAGLRRRTPGATGDQLVIQFELETRLKKAPPPPPLSPLSRTADELGIIRAIEALELMGGNPEARALLKELTQMPIDSLLYQEARAAYGRLTGGVDRGRH